MATLRLLATALAALLLLVSAPCAVAVEHRSHKSRRAGTVKVESSRPRSAFECDLPGGREWYGSTERCLQELCGGKNVTNAHTQDRDGRIRRNPCSGRNQYDLQR